MFYQKSDGISNYLSFPYIQQWAVTFNKDLPLGYDWNLTSDGNIYGRVLLSTIDGDQYYHEDYLYIEYDGLNTLANDITANTTLSGYYAVSDNITISNSATLTIGPGSIIYLAPNKKITVNSGSKIIALGSETMPIRFKHLDDEEGWDRIQLYGGNNQFNWCVFDGGTYNLDVRSSNNTFTNCISKNANIGFYFNNTGTNTVYNCEVNNNNWYGFYLYKSKPTIEDCSIYNNSSRGIYMRYNNYISGDAQILDNLIHDNGSYGIDLYKSSPDIRDNEIYNHTYGISGYNNSSPYLGEHGAYGNNYVHDNSYGLEVSSDCNPFLGEEYCDINGGHNQFIDNNYHIWAETDCYVMAEENYWSPFDSYRFSAHDGSTIDYTPALSQPPSAPLLALNSPEITVYDQAMSVESADFNATAVDFMEYYEKDWNIERKLIFARKIAQLGDIKNSQSICKDIIDSSPDSALAMFALDIIWASSRSLKAEKGYDLDAFHAYLNTLAAKKTKKNIYGYSDLMSTGFETSKMVSTTENVYAKYPNSALAENALFQKFNYYYHELNDISTAKQIASQLAMEYPKSISSRKANEFISMAPAKDIKNSELSEQAAELVVSVPEAYSLSQNYPNPFNPTTRFSFSVPEVSRIKMAIFNTLGQKVKTFAVHTKEAGQHTFAWEGMNDSGQNMPSGLYILRFDAESLGEEMERYSRSIKMLLIR